MNKTVALLVVSIAIGGSASAAERARPSMPGGGIFDPFLSHDSPECVSMGALSEAGAKFMPLKVEAFRFIEGLFVAIPPLSKDLPPGDKAVLAIGPTGEVMATIVDGSQSCARFMIPGPMLDMIANIESGNKTEKSGKDL